MAFMMQLTKGILILSAEVRIIVIQGVTDGLASGIWTWAVSSVGLCCTSWDLYTS